MIEILECTVAPTNVPEESLDSLTQLWILRILVLLGGHRKFLNESGFTNENLARSLGLTNMLDPLDESEEFSSKKMLAALRRKHQELEASVDQAMLPVNLQKNMTQLADLVGLTAAEQQILSFATLAKSVRSLRRTTEWLGELNGTQLLDVLTDVLNLPESQVRQALAPDATLARSGLLGLRRREDASFCDKLALLSNAFTDLMLAADTQPIDLLRGVVSPAQPAHLRLTDYVHVQEDVRILRLYLQRALLDKRKGVNILLYGTPGTGKTQLAGALAQDLNTPLFEVAYLGKDGDPISGNQRLSAFRAAQNFFEPGQYLLIFDEVEDIFRDDDSFLAGKSRASRYKAWMNRMLEENAIPALWLSNSIQDFDPSHLRRFDMVLQLPVPPKKQRERILQAHCGDLANTPTLARMAESEALAPAVITRTSAALRSIRHELPPQGCGDALERMLSNTLEAQGHRPLLKNDPNRLPEIYDPQFIHADADLGAVAAGLVAARTGRLCLYGPPGTGKTAYARWLAEQMEVPLLCKRVSDLISKYLGESEQNIAHAFAQAEQDGALLLIDEVDSFLQDRRGAQQSWEVAVVNEMLTQMESFGGVFIASTNLMTGLDQAALRRFDLKVRLDFLRPEQAWDLMRRYCEQLGLPPPQANLQSRLMRLQRLTPGDFATVRRQHRFHPLTSADALVTALEAECSLKEGGKAAVGFV